MSAYQHIAHVPVRQLCRVLRVALAEARLEISHHIAYYNAERRHSALGYRSPSHFETQLQTTS